jgi:hypothetical protein
MSISLRRYVDITSGVGAGAAVGQRRLVGRFFDDNELIPTGSYVEFESADEVLDYFGSSSEEYDRAAFWFGWVSKNVTNAKAMQFARWASTDTAPQIFGAKGGQSLASWTAISSGAFGLTLGDVTDTISGMDFSAAASLAAVAAIIQAKIRTRGFPVYFTGSISTTTLTVTAVSSGTIEVGMEVVGSGVTPGTMITALGTGTGGTGTYTVDTSQSASSTAMTGGDQDSNYASAVVEYDATRGSFNLTGGDTGAAAVAVTSGGGSDIAGQLGWLSATAIFSDGADEQTVTEVLSESAGADNNFGSFTFLATLTTDEIEESATWNDAQNNMFMYSIPCTADNAAALDAALSGLSGYTLTLAPLSDEYPEQSPMMILAATNYAQRNSTQNYMFQIFGALTPSVTTDEDADTYDALAVNYYGETQTAGQLLAFYQRGVMGGSSSDFLDQNTYANEIWLKDAAAASIMTLLLALNKVPANNAGRAQLMSIVQGVINQALFNGTISVGKALSDTQKLFITNETGDPLAWRQVQNIGYWFDVQIVPYVEDGVTKYKAVYTLIYSKDDVIRKVEGRDIAI